MPEPESLNQEQFQNLSLCVHFHCHYKPTIGFDHQIKYHPHYNLGFHLNYIEGNRQLMDHKNHRYLHPQKALMIQVNKSKIQ